MKSNILILAVILISCNSRVSTIDQNINDLALPVIRDTSNLALYYYNSAIDYLNNSRSLNGRYTEKLDTALMYCDSLIDIDSKTDSYYFLKLEVLRAMDDIESTKIVLKKLIDRFNHPTAYFYLGVILEQEGHFDKALNNYIQANNMYNHFDSINHGLYIDVYSREEAYVYLYGKVKVLKELRKQRLFHPFDFKYKIRKTIAKDFYRDYSLKKYSDIKQ